MHNRTDRGWVRAGLAVLVTGILGGGVLAVIGGPNESRRVTADGVATAGQPAAATPLQPAAPREAAAGGDDPQVGDKVLMGDDGGSVTVSAVEDNVSAGRLFGAGDGFKYVAAEVKGCSGPNEKNITFEPSYFLLRLDDGTIRDPGVGAKKPSLEGGTIPAGRCLSGWVTFNVPTGALPAAVIYDGSRRTTWTVPVPKNAKQTTTTTAPTTAGDSDTTSTTRAKASTTTTTRVKSTATTATTAKSTATTTKSTATTATTAKSTAKSTSTTGATGKSASSASTSTTASTGKSATSTTAPAKASSTTTTGRSVEPDPADSEG